MTILSVNNLTKYYGNICALSNVSFSVPKGCVFGILGPNGSGKTTLLKLIMGLYTDYTGYIYIDNKDISIDDFPSNFLCIPTVSGLHVVASRRELREFLFTKNLDAVDIYKKEPLILLYYNNECKNTNS